MNTTRQTQSKPAAPPLRIVPEVADSPAAVRALIKARDSRSGEDFFFHADQVVSVEPVRDGCCLRLRRGRWVMLAMPARDAAALVWGKAAAA